MVRFRLPKPGQLVHLTLPMSFKRDGKTIGLSSLASIPGETKYLIQGVKVEGSKCGVLYL